MSSAQVDRIRSADHLGLLDDLLDRELADDAAQVPFHHQPDQPFALVGRLGQELLGRRLDRLRIGLHLDLRDRFDGHRHALLRVEVLHRRHVERHQLQRQLPARFDHREDHRAVALDHARAAEAVDDERLVRPGLAIERGQNAREQDHGERHQPHRDADTGRDSQIHAASFALAVRRFTPSATSQLLTAVRYCLPLVRRQLRPRAHVNEPVLVPRDDHLDAFVDRLAVFAARAGPRRAPACGTESRRSRRRESGC